MLPSVVTQESSFFNPTFATAHSYAGNGSNDSFNSVYSHAVSTQHGHGGTNGTSSSSFNGRVMTKAERRASRRAAKRGSGDEWATAHARRVRRYERKKKRKRGRRKK
jgi:hypothetical protein